eukprot:TRINITY_DN28479_c0_g1_i1.p1 TRINITY_DN28479_c0_g1~~TRINITY_DN28479_c0_g1_i1.p1  ORF type:complete len:672 (-),score=59.15 TRINITY_DN28479_c0_g1_i1:312-2327(-)
MVGRPTGLRWLQLVLLMCTRHIGAWYHHSWHPVTDLRCGRGALSEDSIVVSCKVNPKVHDLVSFMVARADDKYSWYFLHLTVEVDWASNGTATARIPDLKPGVEYRFGARTHERGKAIGWRKMWSAPRIATDTCWTASSSSSRRLRGVSKQQFLHEPQFERGKPDRHESREGSESEQKGFSLMDELTTDRSYADKATDIIEDIDLAVAEARQENRSTIWLEVVRHVGNAFSPGSPALPDYLDQHNAADLFAAFSSPKLVPLAPIKKSSFHRYCVEVKIDEVKGVSTPWFGEYKYGTSMFADYVSCKSGGCHCMESIDRSVAGQAWQTIADHCVIVPGWGGRPTVPRNSYGCHCKPWQMAESRKHVGMTPILIPDQWVWPPYKGYPDARLRKAEAHNDVLKPGHWFSFPVGGMCKPGTEMGTNGCNWKLHPVSYSMSLERLHFVHKVYAPGFPAPRSADDSIRWARNARAAFMSLGAAASCGPKVKAWHKPHYVTSPQADVTPAPSSTSVTSTSTSFSASLTATSTRLTSTSSTPEPLSSSTSTSPSPVSTTGTNTATQEYSRKIGLFEASSRHQKAASETLSGAEARSRYAPPARSPVEHGSVVQSDAGTEEGRAEKSQSDSPMFGSGTALPIFFALVALLCVSFAIASSCHLSSSSVEYVSVRETATPRV